MLISASILCEQCTEISFVDKEYWFESQKTFMLKSLLLVVVWMNKFLSQVFLLCVMVIRLLFILCWACLHGCMYACTCVFAPYVYLWCVHVCASCIMYMGLYRSCVYVRVCAFNCALVYIRYTFVCMCI